FAKLWFAAYDSSGEVPEAWAPLFAARSNGRILPIQFALAGMNAHIEHDLPLAVVRTCAACRRTPTSPGVHNDYEKVNDLLAEAEAQIRESFLADLDDDVEPIAHLVSSWSIDKARDFAWVNVQTLWELRRADVLFDAYETVLAQ